MRFRTVLLLATTLFASGCLTGWIDRMTGEDEAQAIRASGIAATARVLRIWDTGMTLNEDPIVGFQLEVHADGVEPFEAETKALIGRLDIPRIQPGVDVPVRYDPTNHKVALDLYVH
jgi:hypothetical protein